MPRSVEIKPKAAEIIQSKISNEDIAFKCHAIINSGPGDVLSLTLCTIPPFIFLAQLKSPDSLQLWKLRISKSKLLEVNLIHESTSRLKFIKWVKTSIYRVYAGMIMLDSLNTLMFQAWHSVKPDRPTPLIPISTLLGSAVVADISVVAMDRDGSLIKLALGIELDRILIVTFVLSKVLSVGSVGSYSIFLDRGVSN